MPYDAFGFLPPGVQLPGETTIAPMLREVEDMRSANRGMLRQIEAETGVPMTGTETAGAVMEPRGVLQDFSQVPAEAPTQRTVQTIPVEPYEDPLVSPQQPPQVASAAPQAPMIPNADEIVQGANQAHVQNNPFTTTTTAAPAGWQLAFGEALRASRPPMPKIGEGMDWSIVPSRPRRPVGPQPQPSRLSMASFLQRS
jgi:hypothetical protein